MNKLILFILFIILSYSGQGQSLHFLHQGPIMKKGNTYSLPLSIVNQNTDTSGNLIGGLSKHLCSYDAKGRKGVDSIYYWNSKTNDWLTRASVYNEITFSGTGNKILRLVYEYDAMVQSKFSLTYTDTFKYDVNENMIRKIGSYLNMPWNNFKVEYTYNSKNEKLTFENFGWDTSKNVYGSFERRRYAYDTDGYLLCEFYETKGGQEQWLVLDSNAVHFAPDHLSYSTFNYEHANYTTYVKGHDSSFVNLDNNGNILTQTLFVLYNNTIVAVDYSSKLTYDADGNILTSWVNDLATTSILSTYTYQSFTGVESETNIHSQFSIFPNPCSNSFAIDLKENNSKPTSIVIRNMQGQEVKAMMINNTSSVNIDIDELPKGIYLVTLVSGEKCFTQKLVKGL